MRPSWAPATTTWTASCSPSSTAAGARTDASAPAWTRGLVGWVGSHGGADGVQAPGAAGGQGQPAHAGDRPPLPPAPARLAPRAVTAGRLLVVGTPIGNLGDLTPRAADALRTADLVVAEDTRLAARLLAHVGARTPTQSFNEHNGARAPSRTAGAAGGRGDAGADHRRGHAGCLRPRCRAGRAPRARPAPRWRSCPGRRPSPRPLRCPAWRRQGSCSVASCPRVRLRPAPRRLTGCWTPQYRPSFRSCSTRRRIGWLRCWRPWTRGCPPRGRCRA